MHQQGKVSAGKLAEWFFAPRAKVEEYLAELQKKQENGMGEGDEQDEKAHI